MNTTRVSTGSRCTGGRVAIGSRCMSGREATGTRCTGGRSATGGRGFPKSIEHPITERMQTS